MWMNGPSSGTSGRDLERAMTKAVSKAQKPPGPSAGAMSWRWISGAPLNGIPRTDAGFIRRGAQDLTPAHTRAHGWDYLPRWQRAAWRGGPTLATPAAGTGWLIDPATTLVVLTVAFVVGASFGAWRIRRAVALFRVQRQVARPLAVALSSVTGENASRILTEMKLPLDYQSSDKAQVVIPLPDDHRPQHITEVGQLVHERLGGEWTGKRSPYAPYTVTFMHKPAPPKFVPFSQVAALIAEQGSQSKILMGIGTNGNPVWLDFDGDIAHLAASVGTGGGKTSFIQFVLAQLAYHGVCDFQIIDVKMDGYEGEIDSLPGMRIYQSLQEQWHALEMAYLEMENRYLQRKADKSTKFPRKIIVLEEQNVFSGRTNAAWKKIKTKDDPSQAPVWEHVGELLFMARAVNINLIGLYQRMSAAASGGTEMRDQYGLKALSRFSHQAWDSLVGTRPRGYSSPVKGRWITVMGSLQRSVQVPYAEAPELMEWVRTRPASTVAIDISKDLPPTGSPRGEVGSPVEFSRPLRESGEGEAPKGAPAALEAPRERLTADEALGLAQEEAIPEPRYLLREAAEKGILPVPYERAKKHRKNDPNFPNGTKDGRSTKFTEAEIRKYYSQQEEVE